jgi:IS30 family transposase
VSRIARHLGKSKSSISEEIKRGKSAKHNGEYSANVAQARSDRNKMAVRRPSVRTNAELMQNIERMIKRRWSPEIISNVLGGVSHTSIYNLIRTIRPEWQKYLVYQRKGRYHKGFKKSLIPNRVDISERAPVKEFGDIEADTVVSSSGGNSCIGVFAERTTRLYKVVKMANKSADEMVKAAYKALSELPVKTITYDNGTENMKHEKINRMLGCKSYFCRPYCSGDKGLVEERNKLLRLWLPKGTNFDLITDAELSSIEKEINERPMKCLDWLSPFQAFHIAKSFGLYL